ncbi:hypothetical protein [Phyllobacterium sp. SB3]|uniref:hypothetical protein n=1 Tax=Phyllobacterium sp. SB3 TaxID=3156073 RepID=UPI0032AF2A4D
MVQPDKTSAHLDTTPKTLRLAAIAGEIEALHPLPDGHGSLSPRIWMYQPAKASQKEQKTGANAPQDHLTNRKTYSLQQHGQMDVMKQDCSHNQSTQNNPST